MSSRLFLLFVAVPALELYLLIKLGQWIGAVETFAIIVGTGLIGSAMAKAEGFAVWSRFNRRLSEGKVPGAEIVDGLIILISGAFLITPGVLTDVVGLLGLFPPSRRALRSMVLGIINTHGKTGINSVFFQFGVRGSNDNPSQEPSTEPNKQHGSGSQSARSESTEKRRAAVSGRAKTRPDYDDE